MKTVGFRALLLLFMMVGCGREKAPDGSYVVDVEATLARARESAKYQQMSPSEIESSEEFLIRVAESMTLSIAGDSFTWSQGELQRSMQATTVEKHGSEWVYHFELNDESVTMQVSWEGSLLALKSSESDDLDSYRWRRVPR